MSPHPPAFTHVPKGPRPGADDAGGVGAPEDPPSAPAPPPPGVAPQMWRISEDQQGPEHPLLPRTLDQPKRTGGEGSRIPQARAMPPSYQPSSASNPPSYAPASASAPSYAPGRDAPSGPRDGGPSGPPGRAVPGRPRRRRGPLRRAMRVVGVLLVVLLAWGAFLLWDANSNLGRVDALSGKADTPGTTYLLAGSDSRADGAVQDGFNESERADSIMLVNVAQNGQTVALSIPRDTYAEIPGYGWDKINASYSYGGAALLVETVEKLTGLAIDHFVQIGMGAVPDMVDAVGGVELCYDNTVSDPYSGLDWEAGCHTVDGTTALAFSRMRYADPEGDIGRTKRQRQVISKVVSAAMSPSTLINPVRTLGVERAGSKSFTVDDSSSNVFTVASLVMALRSATSSEMMGVPPIESLNYTTDAGASAVLLRDTTAPDFFAKLRTGSLTTSDFNQVDGF